MVKSLSDQGTSRDPHHKQGACNGSLNEMDRIYARNAAATADVLFDKKWKVYLLCYMRSGPVRLGQLVRMLPGASKKVLTQHLRQLEADGIVVRTDKSDLVLHVEYEIAERAKGDLLALLDQLSVWGAHHLAPSKQ